MFTTNVHIPHRVGARVHRVRLTHNGERVTWVEHYADGALVGCGRAVRMLPRGVREHVEDRASRCPVREPMYWRRTA